MEFPRNLFIENARREKHSEEFLKHTLDYIDNLTAKSLPVIFSLKHLSILLGLDYHDVKSIIINRNNHYSYYLIKKKRKGFRRIIAPHSNIKILQQWIKKHILDNIELNTYATGFVRNKSILTNAKIHENSFVIFNLDLVNFFETIPEKRVYGIFKSFGYSTNLSVEFAKICTTTISEYRYEELSEIAKPFFDDFKSLEEAVLVQGAPTSPGLSNIICRRLDLRLSKLANKLGVNYSRYADDITFSGLEINLPKISLLKKIIQNEGFKLNWDKINKYKSGQKQIVTGLLINGNVRIPKKFKKDIYRHLYFCKKFGPTSHFQRINPGKGYKKEWLLGKIYFVNSIEPIEAKKMLELVNQINWEI